VHVTTASAKLGKQVQRQSELSVPSVSVAFAAFSISTKMGGAGLLYLIDEASYTASTFTLGCFFAKPRLCEE
jgi:hypothetical protein